MSVYFCAWSVVEMQDILLKSLWYNSELSHKVCELSRAMPGYHEAEQAHNAVAKQVQDILGFELYDRYTMLLMRFLDYDTAAWYALGLGIRADLVKMFGF